MQTTMPSRDSTGPQRHAAPGDRRRFRSAAAAVLACAAALAAPAAQATTITDAADDFLSTFAGPHGADLDVLSAQATYNNDSIFLSATLAGDVGTTAGGFYVWGIDRGGATDLLNRQPNPVGAGVTFNSIVVLRPDGTGFALLLNPDLTPASPAEPVQVTIAGRTISAIVSRGFLPSTGADINEFGFNLWPRVAGFSNDQVADFGPDASTFHASEVPEPASWALMISGFGLAGATLRRRQARTA